MAYFIHYLWIGKEPYTKAGGYKVKWTMGQRRQKVGRV